MPVSERGDERGRVPNVGDGCPHLGGVPISPQTISYHQAGKRAGVIQVSRRLFATVGWARGSVDSTI